MYLSINLGFIFYLCFRYNLPSHLSHHSSSPGPANPRDGPYFPHRPPHLDADVQGMSLRLRMCSAKQRVLPQAPPRPSLRSSPGFPFRHQVPVRPQGLSPPQENIFRPELSIDYDHDPQSIEDQTGRGFSDRLHQSESKESFLELGVEQDDDDDHWQMSGPHRHIRAPMPVRFRPDLPRPPMPPQLRGMRPPSLMALDVARPPTLRHQQPLSSQEDLSRPLSLLRDGQNSPYHGDEEILSQGPPAQMSRSSNKLVMPPSQAESQRPISVQHLSESRHNEKHLRPPRLPGGFRPSWLPTARQPSLPQHLRMPNPSKDSQSLQQQNSQRPPSFSKDHTLQEGRFPFQVRMPPVASLHPVNETQDSPRLPAPTDSQHYVSRDMQQDTNTDSGLSDMDSVSQEEVRQIPMSLKAGPPSLMDMNIHRPPLRPVLPPSGVKHKPMSNVCEISEPNVTLGSEQLTAGLQPSLGPPLQSVTDSRHIPQVGMSDEPLQFTGRMPSHSVSNFFPRNPLQPAIRNSGMRPPFPLSTVAPLPVSNQTFGATSSPVDMSDEPLQFTGTIPTPRIRHPQQQLVHISGIRKPSLQFAEDKTQMQGAGNDPVCMSDKSLQFRGRIPPLHVRGQSFPQRPHLPGSSFRPPTAAVDSPQIQGVGVSNEPPQFTGRMPMPHIRGPSFPLQQRLPVSDSHPSTAPQSAVDSQQAQAGVSDSLLQFNDGMPTHRVQGPSSYQQAQQLPNSENSTAISAPGQPPTCLPPGMHPSFIPMPRRSLPPPMGLSDPRMVHDSSARLPPPFPGIVHHPADGSVSLPMLPPPALRLPFFPSMSNLVRH